MRRLLAPCWGNFRAVLLLILTGLLASPADSLPLTWDGRPLLRPLPPRATDTPAKANPWIIASARDSLRFEWLSKLETYPHQILTTLFKPVDMVVRPTFRLISLPLKPMITYADTSELIERGNALMRMGDKESSTMLYPVATLTGNSSSRAGVRFRRAWNPALRSDAAIRWSPSEEWGIWLSGSADNWPDGFGSSASFVHYQTPGAPIWVPGHSTLSPSHTADGSVSESRQQLDVGIGKGIGENLSAGCGVQFVLRDAGLPVRLSDRLPANIPWLAEDSRGTSGITRSYGIGGQLAYSDQDRQGIPTKGGRWSIDASQHITNQGGGMAGLGTSGTRYLLLGKEKYAFKRSDLDPYLDFDPGTLLQVIDPTTLWQRLTERRVLGVYWTIQQAWENGTRPAPWFFFPTMGGNVPARAYDTRLTALSLFGGGVEYRWPIWKYLDGSIYAEAAHASRLPWQLSYQGFAPGWGLGLRVRSENSFFFRFQLASGRTGTTYYLTTSPEF